MNYVFTFIGEFGYELLNWQGTIRKWANLYKKDDDKVIVCSRRGLQSLYEFADHYIDISNLKSYNDTIGDCYTCYVFTNEGGSDAPRPEWAITRTGKQLDDVKRDVMLVVNDKIKNTQDETEWIWSSDFIEMGGLTFGLEFPGGRSGIYNEPQNKLNVDNNEYKLISTFNDYRNDIEEELNFDLSKPYILCQTGWRKHIGISKTEIDYEVFIPKLTEKYNVIFLNFETGRTHDSYSKFENKYMKYKCKTFDEQATLISNADHCVFFTEGDFRSHLYLPPFLGKDVHTIASKDIWNLHSAPYEFWNENIFKFGGQIIPYVYEDVIKDLNQIKV